MEEIYKVHLQVNTIEGGQKNYSEDFTFESAELAREFVKKMLKYVKTTA